jgi:hypothetical protein
MIYQPFVLLLEGSKMSPLSLRVASSPSCRLVSQYTENRWTKRYPLSVITQSTSRCGPSILATTIYQVSRLSTSSSSSSSGCGLFVDPLTAIDGQWSDHAITSHPASHEGNSSNPTPLHAVQHFILDSLRLTLPPLPHSPPTQE